MAKGRKGSGIKFAFDMAGLKDIVQRLDDLAKADALVKDAGQILFAQATEIMNASKLLVPVDTGFLRQSGHVQIPQISGNRVMVTFGYAASYALYVHENPRAGNTGGFSPAQRDIGGARVSQQSRRYKRYAQTGTWKFLEVPYRAWKQGHLKVIADGFRAARSIGIATRRRAA